MFSVKIKGKRISYDINFRSRYVVVIGDSGTGKTFFTNLLMNRKKEPGYSFELSEMGRAIVTPGDALHVICEEGSFKKRPFLLIADDKDFEFDEDTKLFVEEAVDTHFLLITRNEYIPNLNYSIAETYTFRCVNKTNILLPVFTYDADVLGNSPLHPSVHVVTEDTRAGKQFYENLLNRKAEEFPGGKDHVIDWLLAHEDDITGGVLLCVDWCSFGSHVVELNSFLSKTKCSPIIMLLDARSFEYVILSSNFFGKEEYTLDLSVKSEEVFYEERLSDLTDNTPLKLVHDKATDLPVCYTEKCCAIVSRSKNVNRGGCTRGLSGEDKFVAMFVNTDMEILLKLAGRV